MTSLVVRKKKVTSNATQVIFFLSHIQKSTTMEPNAKLSEQVDQIISDNENNLSNGQREELANKNAQLREKKPLKERLELAADILKIILLVEEAVHHIPWK